jgi:hypothetical protein
MGSFCSQSDAVGTGGSKCRGAADGQRLDGNYQLSYALDLQGNKLVGKLGLIDKPEAFIPPDGLGLGYAQRKFTK